MKYFLRARFLSVYAMEINPEKYFCLLPTEFQKNIGCLNFAFASLRLSLKLS
jgi:hypothetical protein|tara:strand:- start:329 stop:484 length:156 start_codon:yes stop_codon:yes gene_type:complete